MRRVVAVLCALVLMCGCGSVEELPTLDVSDVGNSFASLMEYAGYEVVEDKEAASSDEFVKKIEIAVMRDEYQVEMYYISDSSKATKYFADFCRIFNAKTKTADSESVKNTNSSVYCMKDAGMFYRIVRYDDKILVVSAEDKYEENVLKIIKRLGEIYGIIIAS